MLNKIVTLISIIIIFLCILIGNIPSSISYDQYSNLDPSEGYISTSVWSFYYGFSSTYGPYIRDVQWAASGPKDLYIGMANIPYVGADVLGSAVGMDKDVLKRLLRDAGIPTPIFEVFDRRTIKNTGFDKLAEKLGKTMFIKPANLGSSVGISTIKRMTKHMGLF